MTYDAIIIGAGHNGLVAAALLAKAGLKVLVLEQRATLGGLAATEEVFPGFNVNTGSADISLFRAELIRELGLTLQGLEIIEGPVSVFAPQPDGRALTLWRDVAKTQAEIAAFCPPDADKFPAFSGRVATFAGVLRQVMTLTPPDIEAFSQGAAGSLKEMAALPLALPAIAPWATVALKVRRLGRRDMMEFLRVLPMTVAEFLDEYFEGGALKGALGAAGVLGNQLGPMAAGTTLMFLYQHMEAAGALRPLTLARLGTGKLAESLAAAARQQGAEIRTGAAVQRIVTQDGRATGVTLADGEPINARVILSSADPRRTFFKLIDPAVLEPRFMRRVRAMRYRGCTARATLALSGLPQFKGQTAGPEQLSGRIVISPSLEYLERAADDAKYGRLSERPLLEATIPTILDPTLAPTGRHLMSVTVQYAPYHLQDGDWDEQRERLGDLVVETLAGYAPGLPGLILDRLVLTPLDYERDYGATEGSIYHGQMGLDQLLFMRPVAGYGRYRTPFAGLYLCGSGAHPGGGVTGLPGYNAGREVLKEFHR